MKNRRELSGTIKTGNKSVRVHLPIIKFEEDGCKLVYCPAVDITGYGSTDDEAEESFFVSLTEFIKYTLNKGTLFQSLKKLGWHIPGSKRALKTISPPSMSDLLAGNDNFSRIFNEHSFQKIDRTIDLPLAV